MSTPTFEQLLEAIRHQQLATTAGDWAANTDGQSVFSSSGFRVATGLLPQDSRWVEIAHRLLPDLIERYDLLVGLVGQLPEGVPLDALFAAARGVQRSQLSATKFPCIKVDEGGCYWIDGHFGGRRRRLRCGTLDEAHAKLVELR